MVPDEDRRVRACGLVLALLLLAWPSAAQSPQIQRALTSATCPGTGCVTLSIQGLGAVGMQITGTFVGTIAFESTLDGVTYTDLSMTPTAGSANVIVASAPGVWTTGLGGVAIVRARMSAYTSGTAVVTLQGGVAGGTLLQQSNTWSGTQTFDNVTVTGTCTGCGGGGSGTIGGSIASHQVAVGSGADTIAGSSGLTWDGSTLAIDGAVSVSGVMTLSGSIAGNGGTLTDDLTWVANPIGLAYGGTGAVLADPNADRIYFWDDSAGATAFLTLGTGLSITGTTINATSGAPTDATYITQTANSGLSAEQALASLATGVLKSTTTTGVVSIAAAADIIGLWTGTCNSSSVLGGDGVCSVVSSAFSGITSGTNTVAAMVVGTGASLAASGSGTITATAAPASGISGLGTGVATWLATPSSANLASALTDETGSGLAVFATSPALTTPSLGVATATSVNGNAFTTGTYTLTGGASKTLTFNNTLTLAGTDSTTMTFPTTSASIARTDSGNVFAGENVIAHGTITTALSPLAITETRNASGITFPGITYNVTDTASAATSPYIDFQRNGTTKMSVRKVGNDLYLRIGSGTANPHLGANGANLQLYDSSQAFNVAYNGIEYRALATGSFGASPGADPSVAADTSLCRSGAGVWVTGTTNTCGTVGTVKSKYQSSDGTAGATTTCTIVGLTSITVKDGLITSCS